ncbi:MAG: hypothetical protein JWQ40_3789 [Segetibacter sp.]|nr:hypothetical protein [Segetibacter sp.]
MKKFIVTCSPPDGGETNFLVEVESRSLAKDVVDEYINQHEEFELGLSGEYILTCDRYKEGALVDIDLTVQDKEII